MKPNTKPPGAPNEVPAPAAAAAQPEAVKQEPSSLKVEFALGSREVLEKLSQEGEGRLEMGRYSMVVFPQAKNKIDLIHTDQGFQTLASEARNLAVGQPSLVFRGGKDPKSNETVGFYVEVTPVRQTERGTEYRLSIKRALPEISAAGQMTIASQNFDETVTVPHNGAVTIAGLLPRRPLVEGEEEIYKTNILKALLDPNFQKADSEFLILINPRLNEPTN